MAKKTRSRHSARRPAAPARKAAEASSSTQPACPIAGFGASAGGLEAFSELLHALPPDTGMAFVLIQHLDPKHGSLLTELLQKATRMRVVEVKDGMAVEADHVFVIPPNAEMTIAKNFFHLEPRHPQHMPIDQFFRSLAQE